MPKLKHVFHKFGMPLQRAANVDEDNDGHVKDDNVDCDDDDDADEDCAGDAFGLELSTGKYVECMLN